MTDQEHKELHDLRQLYQHGVKLRRGWTLPAMQAEYERFNRLAVLFRQRNTRSAQAEEDTKLLTEFYWLLVDERKRMEDVFKADNPLAWFKPSWEQCQILNSWHPEFEPNNAPEGYRTALDFGGVQGGKTTALIVNALLWQFPNDPDWPIFQEQEDEHGRGKYRVFPRWDFDEWKRSGRRIYNPDLPPKANFEGWIGCVDEAHWKQKIIPKLEKLVPKKWLGRKGKDLEWFPSDKWFRTKWGGSLVGKLYNSEMQSWGGMRVHYIGLDEGPPADKLEESVVRCTYLCWVYSPREAVNMGDRVLVAKRAWDGKTELPGYPDTPPFRAMTEMEKIPDRIMPFEDRRTRIAIAEKMGDKGKPILGTGFFIQGGLVFTNFKRERIVLPWTGAEVLAAYKGEGGPLNSIFLRANILRGFDEGTSHPTACAWAMLLRTGELVVYRDMEESGISITDRARLIVERSGNKWEKIERTANMTMTQMNRVIGTEVNLAADRSREEHTGIRIVRYKEIAKREPVRKTWADSKMFKRDPAYPGDDWVQNYDRAGLKLERARNIGPAARCDFINNMFIDDYSRQHLNPEQCTDLNMNGHRLYICRDCTMTIERIENYQQGIFTTGPRKGEFTGKPAEGKEDILDALGYICIADMRWIDMEDVARNIAMAGGMASAPLSSVTGY